MFGIWVIRSGNSVLGYAEAWMKEMGKIRRFPTLADAEREAKRLNNEIRSPNVTYFAKALLSE